MKKREEISLILYRINSRMYFRVDINFAVAMKFINEIKQDFNIDRHRKMKFQRWIFRRQNDKNI